VDRQRWPGPHLARIGRKNLHGPLQRGRCRDAAVSPCAIGERGLQRPRGSDCIGPLGDVTQLHALIWLGKGPLRGFPAGCRGKPVDRFPGPQTIDRPQQSCHRKPAATASPSAPAVANRPRPKPSTTARLCAPRMRHKGLGCGIRVLAIQHVGRTGRIEPLVRLDHRPHPHRHPSHPQGWFGARVTDHLVLAEGHTVEPPPLAVPGPGRRSAARCCSDRQRASSRWWPGRTWGCGRCAGKRPAGRRCAGGRRRATGRSWAPDWPTGSPASASHTSRTSGYTTSRPTGRQWKKRAGPRPARPCWKAPAGRFLSVPA